MTSKSDHLKKLKDQLATWEKQIEQLKAKSESVSAEAQVKYYKEIEDVRMLQKSAQQKLDALSAGGEDAWEELKQDMGSAYGNIKSTLSKTKKAFKEGLNETKEK
ncbi:MAG: coiled coil domain-containing protein [Candidatus Nitrohelix vancouverensis]|uniref:Coiled coil domain-containing protein n=1 Tax=Candidatus Nitrohelix vancouverensis TaxID=2705534 RepID=A0A7T0C0A2_9BACT|nr:MAG: coiled coil domain-containing protein [Candidatus Nitrohelix vancouverensis]